MLFSSHKSYSLDDRSFASIIKREIKGLAENIGFAGTRLGEVEIVASEIITNLIKHATSGKELLVKRVEEDKTKGIEFIALDNGPGITDLSRMMQDGQSTVNTLGQGLGAIKRLSQDFDIFTQPEWGTILLSRLYLDKNFRENFKPNVMPIPRVIRVPKPNEKECGDGWAYKYIGNTCRILACDGLGHGPEANVASEAAMAYLMQNESKFPADVLIGMHDEIRRTRGVVAALVDFDLKQKSVNYCGVGNIGTKMLSSTLSKSFISYNGILGMNRPGILHNQKFLVEGAQQLIMVSDGIKSRWESAKYASISRHDSSIMAASIYKEFSRRTDDTLVIVFSPKRFKVE